TVVPERCVVAIDGDLVEEIVNVPAEPRQFGHRRLELLAYEEGPAPPSISARRSTSRRVQYLVDLHHQARVRYIAFGPVHRHALLLNPVPAMSYETVRATV